MLTRKQRELLLYINQRLNATGVSPSFDEMKDALKLKSKSGIHRLVSGLEERGFIRRLPHRARALEVIKLPEESGVSASRAQPTSPARGAPNSGIGEPAGSLIDERNRFSPTVIRGDFKASLPGSPVAPDVEAVELPLYGRIAAGTPIEALRDQSATVGVPASLLGHNGEHYALQVAGDSMVEAGILDGDTVIVQRAETAENGAIVVALVDNQEVTLKRLRRRGASIALEPANKAYETRIFGPDRVKVQGRLVGLLRRY
ncbi:MAG TPA: transcriptional repressor LexA [Stellaceae bacterium]|nr:transcriptional repressor LexA [Stellaceae bacterium]